MYQLFLDKSNSLYSVPMKEFLKAVNTWWRYGYKYSNNSPNYFETWPILHCGSEKMSPYYFCDIFLRYVPILPILGKNIACGIWNKCVHCPLHLILYVRSVPRKNFQLDNRPAHDAHDTVVLLVRPMWHIVCGHQIVQTWIHSRLPVYSLESCRSMSTVCPY